MYTYTYVYTSRWAYHAKNSSWYTLLKYLSPSMIHPIFENVDYKMVVVPSRLWLPLFHPRLSGAVLAQGPRTQCYWVALASRIDKMIGLFCKRAL